MGVEDAVAKVSTQSPFAATLIDTPVASFTSAVQVPLDTVAACAGEAKKVDGIATIDTTRRLRAPTSDKMVRIGEKRLTTSKSYS